ncbi:MAG: hypothetical protein ACRDHF_18505, partial [Tepidiformaceae bacterium]
MPCQPLPQPDDTLSIRPANLALYLALRHGEEKAQPRRATYAKASTLEIRVVRIEYFIPVRSNVLL